MENETLATEMLHELKANCKRWFIIAIVLLVALVGSNIAWLLFESQYETVTDETEQYITQEQSDTNNSNMSGVIN